MLSKKDGHYNDASLRELERKVQNMSESIAYYQGCVTTIGKELYRITDKLLELKYLIQSK